MAATRKNCSGTKGYNCGNTCITVKNACRVDGLKGQSVNIMKQLEQARKAAVGKPVVRSMRDIMNQMPTGGGLFPDPDTIVEGPKLKPSKPVLKSKSKGPVVAPKGLDIDKVERLSNPTSTDVAKQINNSGYRLPVQVKGETIRLHNNRDGIIDVVDGKISHFNLSDKLLPVINKIQGK